MDDLNIMVSTDRNYVKHLIAMLHSLFDTNRDCIINIHVLHSSLNDDDLSAIEKVVTNYNGVFYSHKISANHESETMHKKTRLPKEAYFRLICMDYLPGDVKKVLYLDCDIIINGSIQELYNTDMTGIMFAAAYDYIEVIGDEFNKVFDQKKRKSEYELMPDTCKYINSGVLLMNIELIRKSVTTDEMINMIENLGSRNILLYHDQDFINFVFHKYIKYIDYKIYNYFPIYKDWEELKPEKPLILHFAGPFKPWEDDYYELCEQYVAVRNNRTRPFVEQAKELYDKYASLDSSSFYV